MSSNPTLEDEHVSLNSIYGDTTLSSPTPAPDGLEAVLSLPSHPSVALRVFFPREYPDEPPFVQGTHSIGADLPKGAGHVAVARARETLARVFVPGAPCLFDLAEELGAELAAALEDANVATAPARDRGLSSSSVEQLQDAAVSREAVGLSAAAAQRQEMRMLGPEPAWVLSDVITEKKSVFVARCVGVASVAEAQRCIAHLLATDKRAARATHNISAWRIGGASSSSSTGGDAGAAATAAVAFQDYDDDGETAAGGRLLRLLQMMDVWGVVVVVSRWYGGILLGPARFAIINEAARDAVSRWQLEKGADPPDEAKGHGHGHGKSRKK